MVCCNAKAQRQVFPASISKGDAISLVKKNRVSRRDAGTQSAKTRSDLAPLCASASPRALMLAAADGHVQAKQSQSARLGDGGHSPSYKKSRAIVRNKANLRRA
jgi:hypothetical protein